MGVSIILFVRFALSQPFSMPFFHADVHAGNLLLLQDGRVGFIDFGIVGRISDKVFAAVNELSAALAVGDSQGMAVALCNMGATEEDVDTVKFGEDIARILDRMNNVETDLSVTAYQDGTVSGSLNVDESEITGLLLELVEVTGTLTFLFKHDHLPYCFSPLLFTVFQFYSVSENNGLKLPREFGLLVKQSLYFDRYLKILAPSVDVMNDSRVMIGGQTRETTVNGDSSQQIIDV